MARVLIADPLAVSAVQKMKDAGLEIVNRDKEADGPIEKQILGFLSCKSVAQSLIHNPTK